MTDNKVICVSGGFDPVHIGHLRMIEAASHYGEVVVIVNSDAWLMRKKGYIFMPFDERCEILQGFSAVSRTTYVKDEDDTVCEALKRIKPFYFANGGDRKTDNTPEMEVCKKEGIELLWSMGGGKIQSSSQLVDDSGLTPIVTTEIDGVDITPSRVVVIAAHDLPKN